MDAIPPDSGPLDPVVGGILVKLTGDPAQRDAALAALRDHPAMTLGSVHGDWLTLAIEAPNAAEARDLHCWVATLPGVEWLEVTAVFFTGREPAMTDLLPLATATTPLRPQETLP